MCNGDKKEGSIDDDGNIELEDLIPGKIELLLKRKTNG